MIGVVVWSSGSREKAIIWCEDQATLAYLQGSDNLVDPRKWPQPGDLVELETQTIGNLRHAFEVSMLSEQCCPQIPRILAEVPVPPRQPHLRVVSDGEGYCQPRSLKQDVGNLPYAVVRNGAACR